MRGETHTHPESAVTKGGLSHGPAESVGGTNARATNTKRSHQRLHISTASARSQPLHHPAFHKQQYAQRGTTTHTSTRGWRGERLLRAAARPSPTGLCLRRFCLFATTERFPDPCLNKVEIWTERPYVCVCARTTEEEIIL